MPKSLRTAFIRISAHNETKDGIVDYSYDDIKNMVLAWSTSKKFKYYVKDHNNEPGDMNPHYHLVLKFNSPTPFNDIKAVFPYGDIESAKNTKNCIQYLVHMNDLSKTQYDFSEIFTNDLNIDKYRLISHTNQLLKLEDYILKIEKGEIREFNLTDNIPIEIFTNHKSKILNALEFFRRKVMTDKDRNITVLFFSGDTGTFKTTYAKQYAKNLGKSICISSSSNDAMQDYMGEDVLVLDDIRDTTFKFHDLLKVLDNHTKSTVASRYSNKAFIGDTIIITTSLALSEWYFNEAKEDKIQLYRRIPIQMQFTQETIKVFEFNDKARKYVFRYSVPNTSCMTVKKAKINTLETLKAMGLQITEEVQQQFLSLDSANDNTLVGDYIGNDEEIPF